MRVKISEQKSVDGDDLRDFLSKTKDGTTVIMTSLEAIKVIADIYRVQVILE